MGDLYDFHSRKQKLDMNATFNCIAMCSYGGHILPDLTLYHPSEWF